MKTYLFLFSVCASLSALAENQIFFGPLASYTQLDSKNTGVFHGASVGGSAGYQYTKPMALFARTYVACDWSDLKHSATHSQINVINLSANADLGFTANFGKQRQYSLAPYSGFAYRYIQEHRSITGFDSYYVIYKKPLIPLGMFFLADISSLFSFGLNYEYQFDIDPTAKLNFMKGALWKLQKANDQSIAAIFSFKPANHWTIEVTPYYSCIKTGNSTAIASDGTALGIQKQTYQVYGGSLACSYFF